MRWLDRLAMKFRTLLARQKAGAQLDAELSFHLENQIAENLAAGMSKDEARRAALRAFGNPALLRDETRATWSWNWLESLGRDLRYSVRTLRRTPGFAIIAITVMALGIGANVALFTVVRSVLLKPLPFNDPDRLLMVNESSTGEIPNSVAGGMFNGWRRYNQTFERMAVVTGSEKELSGEAGQLPERLKGAENSWELFSTLGVHPVLGRDFTAADDSPTANGAVILSFSLWKRRFGSDLGVVGRTVSLNAKPFTVIGVMPAWFAFPEPSTELWTAAYYEISPSIVNQPDNHMFGEAVGRLKPGVTGERAIADLSAISLRIHNQHLDKPFVHEHAYGRPLLERMVGKLKQPLYVLLTATSCLLFIACLNVANLLVARAAARRREMAIRTALGGSWLRILRERLIESLVLSCLGGTAGLLLAYGILLWLVRTRQDMARVEAIHIDAVVAIFTLGVVAFSALFSGLISAFSTGDARTVSALQENSRTVSGGRAFLRKALVSIEIGLTVVLLIGAGLLIRSYERLRATDVGCITDNVLTMRIALPQARYGTPEVRANFFDAFLTRLRAMPGIEAATFATMVPGQGYGSDWGFTIPDHPPLPIGQGDTAIMRYVDSDYFSALGIPILRGRTFDESKRLDRANEVVISQSLAHTFYPNEDPIGKHLKLFDTPAEVIVGVVADARYLIGEEPRPIQYHEGQRSGKAKNGTLIIRSSQDVELLALPVQKVVNELDHDLAVSDVLTMNQMIGKSTLNESFNVTLLLAFAVLATLLAAVGLFGVLSYVVAQRTTEIGIRMALGAQREQVLRRVLFDGLRPALIGLVFGIAGGAATVRLIQSMLYQTRPLDPVVFAAVACGLLAVAAIACAVPAWRASRLDPMQALRTE